jgi:hypothetical protein
MLITIIIVTTIIVTLLSFFSDEYKEYKDDYNPHKWDK